MKARVLVVLEIVKTTVGLTCGVFVRLDSMCKTQARQMPENGFNLSVTSFHSI